MTAVWYELTIDVSPECSEAVANFLMEQGAPGLQSDEQGNVTSLTAYFSHEPPLEPLYRFCAHIGCSLPEAGGGSVRARQIAAEDWAENWKKHFEPQLVGSRLYICPPWDSVAPPDRVAVVIDPGMAFGTGQHASTRGCLELLERATRERQVTRALDLGTGSGVLAIALAKLGVTEVWAIDNDPRACAIAATNAEHNGVAEQIHVASSLGDDAGTFDLVTANLFANVLEELAPQLTDSLTPSGILICSGLMTADEARVRATYDALGLEVANCYEEHPWVTLALQRKTRP